LCTGINEVTHAGIWELKIKVTRLTTVRMIYVHLPTANVAIKGTATLEIKIKRNATQLHN